MFKGVRSSVLSSRSSVVTLRGMNHAPRRAFAAFSTKVTSLSKNSCVNELGDKVHFTRFKIESDVKNYVGPRAARRLTACSRASRVSDVNPPLHIRGI